MQTYQTEEQLRDDFRFAFQCLQCTVNFGEACDREGLPQSDKKIEDWWLSKLQAREEWLLKSVSDLLEKTELKCDSQVYEQCSFCKLKYDLLQLLTPKN